MKKAAVLWVLLCCWSGFVIGQQADIRRRPVLFVNDSLVVDTLSLIPGTVRLLDSLGSPVDTASYRIAYFKSLIVWTAAAPPPQKMSLQYRCYPLNFYKSYRRDYTQKTSQEDFVIYKVPQKSATIFNDEGFQNSGSITRGIMLTNGQNSSLTSDMNLRLSGYISPGIKLTAAISDNNIPIQPDGNTQQLQDFDRVFVRLDHRRGSLVAGDYVLLRPDSRFLNYRKKAQGLRAEVQLNKVGKGRLRTYAAMALAKGKYNRYRFQGLEGNQGPYKLQGANYERYIVVLSGSEKVYMDGKVLKRGQNEDYVINYNTAEITFTPKIMVTKDKRFEVEFEYTERAYARAMLAAGLEYQTGRLRWSSHFFHEGDMKNQQLNRPLSTEDKKVLYAVGDSVQQAVVLSLDSSTFLPDRVMYKMIDSLGYDSVLVYSISPDSAFYSVSFSMVGAGHGDYIRIPAAANGPVYQWVQPLNGRHQGDYAPVRLLVSPGKKEMLTNRLRYKLTKNMELEAEVALSIHDINTFSPFDDANNKATATYLGFHDTRSWGHKKQAWKLNSALSYRYLQKDFTAIERFREVEFDRNWSGLSKALKADEQELQASLALQKMQWGSLSYKLSSYYKTTDYRGLRHAADLRFHRQGFSVNGKASLTNTRQNTTNTSFLKHAFTLSQQVKAVQLGVFERSERNVFNPQGLSLALPGSFAFNEMGAFVQSADTSTARLRMDYKHRSDAYSDSLQLHTTTMADELSLTGFMGRRPSNRLTLTAGYRLLSVQDSTLTDARARDNLMSRFTYRLRSLKGSFTLHTFYEVGSGLEPVKEYGYLEVAAGQGVYSWTDYNNNGVKELDEFEIAAFTDQANYIRILLPTNTFVKTYGNSFSLIAHVRPMLLWRKTNKRWLKALRLLSDQFTFRSSQKTQTDDPLSVLSPVLNNLLDPGLIRRNAYLKNTLFLGRSNPRWGMEWTYLKTSNKLLMVNGFNGTMREENKLYTRLTAIRRYLMEIRASEGYKAAFSEYFLTGNYHIRYYDMRPAFTLQPGHVWRLALEYRYVEKYNRSELAEKAFNHSLTLRGKYNSPGRGSLSAFVSYLDWAYNSTAGTQLAFTMLEGFSPGVNYRWNLSYSKTLMENLQFSLVYDGRKPAIGRIIHTGMVQLRAYF